MQQQVQVAQTLATRDRDAIPLAALTKAERDSWIASPPTVPTDGIVRQMADKITAGPRLPARSAARHFDWVVDTAWRNPDTPGGSTGDFEQMLETNHFGGTRVPSSRTASLTVWTRLGFVMKLRRAK